jgi:hypothetical protein
VLLDEGDRLPDGAVGERADLHSIDDAAPVDAAETAGLYPGIREVPLAFLSEEQYAADRGDLAALVVGHEPQSRSPRGELADVGEIWRRRLIEHSAQVKLPS